MESNVIWFNGEILDRNKSLVIHVAGCLSSLFE